MTDATPNASLAARLVRAAVDLLDQSAKYAASIGLDAAAGQLEAAADELSHTVAARLCLPEELADMPQPPPFECTVPPHSYSARTTTGDWVQIVTRDEWDEPTEDDYKQIVRKLADTVAQNLTQEGDEDEDACDIAELFIKEGGRHAVCTILQHTWNPDIIAIRFGDDEDDWGDSEEAAYMLAEDIRDAMQEAREAD
jgi:hypothetical protein